MAVDILLRIGGMIYNLELQQAGTSGEIARAYAHLADAPPMPRRPEQRGRVEATIHAVHVSGCRATVLGKRAGPCNCGAQETLERVLSGEVGVV